MTAPVADALIADLVGRGFARIDHAPRDPRIRPGARVRNAAEQFPRAFAEGAAEVVAVLRKGTDERPDHWEMAYGRPNVEVVIRRDGGLADGSADTFAAWADYGTCPVDEPVVSALAGATPTISIWCHTGRDHGRCRKPGCVCTCHTGTTGEADAGEQQNLTLTD